MFKAYYILAICWGVLSIMALLNAIIGLDVNVVLAKWSWFLACAGCCYNSAYIGILLEERRYY